MPVKPPTFRAPGYRPAPDKRPEVQDPYYGTQAWKRLRVRCLQRDGFRCTAPDCRDPIRGQGGRLIADHIIERSKGGPDTLSNLRTLCPSCDNQRHGRKGWGG